MTLEHILEREQNNRSAIYLHNGRSEHDLIAYDYSARYLCELFPEYTFSVVNITDSDMTIMTVILDIEFITKLSECMSVEVGNDFIVIRKFAD